MQLQPMKSIRRTGLVLIISTMLLLGTFVDLTQDVAPAPAQAATEQEIFDEVVANIPPQQSRECDGTETGLCNDGTCTHSESEVLACVFSGGVAEWYGTAGPPGAPQGIDPEAAPPIEVLTEAPPPPPPSNLIINGNFESGFYAVPELGFEPPDIGNVPKGWFWYKNRAYGKYTIFNNQTLGLECPYGGEAPPVVEDDPVFGPIPGVTNESATSALGLHIQSSDEQDARIGVYQVIDGLTPGQTYRLSMSGTLQIQSGATTLQPDDPRAPEEAPNHTIELYFDHTANTDWRAIPHEKWTIIEWEEQKLEFKVSRDDDDLAEIQSYQTFVTAQSNQMTIFLTLWRKWANWRTGIASIDCVALQPATSQMMQAAQQRRTNFVDLSGGSAEPSDSSSTSSSDAQPAAAGLQPDTELPITGDQAQPSPEPQSSTATQPDVSTEQEISQPTSSQQPADAVAVDDSSSQTAVVNEQVQSQSTSLPEIVQQPVEETAEAAEISPTSIETNQTSSSILILFGAAIAAFALVGIGLWRMK